MKEVQQAEALRLADALENGDCFDVGISGVAYGWKKNDPTFEAAEELRRQHARIAELEKENSYMNNACAELEAQLDAIGAGGVEPLSKGFVRLSDVLARLEQGFGTNSAPATTIKRHFEMQAHPAHPAEGVPAKDVEIKVSAVMLKVAALIEKCVEAEPCAEAEAELLKFLRTSLAATHPTQQGLDQANCKGGNWLTVVYRDIRPGDEARTIGEHPKVSALSWSHALNERDAALAANHT